ncbi:MAG: DUF937 domain-containing protein [Coriobacteriia bacterium]|nr:DUF937 domain-containing protein [Coriobacteriia bacterium]
MDALTRGLMDQLAGGGLAEIGDVVGVDERSAGSALSAAMPLLVSALGNNASKPQGAGDLLQALQSDHDGSILGNLGSLLQNPAAGEGPGILEHALGASQPAVEQGLAQKTGLSAEQIGKLLMIAAPLVMGMLGKTQREEGLDAGGLSSLLGSAMQTDAQAAPDIMSILNSALDSDKDGSAVDEVMGFFGKMFKK